MPSRAYVEAALEGVPLPATREVLMKYLGRQGEKAAAGRLKDLPSGRFNTIDEVGEALEPVQPRWPRQRRVPKAESGLPPGGPSYGIDPGRTQ